MLEKKLVESVERYRKAFPKISEGKSDIEILLYRNVISANEAKKLMKSNEPKIKITREKTTKVRPYTQKQIIKIGRAAAKDFKSDFPETSIEDAAYDLAESLLFGDERMQAYFEKSGVEKRNWKASLADYFVE